MYEHDLICDLWQTYGITDYRSIPMRTLAVLAWGLPVDSRVYERIIGIKESPHKGMMAVNTVDAIMMVYCALVGEKNPPFIARQYMQQKQPTSGFATGAEFEEFRKEILKKHGK